MSSPFRTYFNHPERGPRRRTVGMVLLMALTVAVVVLVAFARQKPLGTAVAAPPGLGTPKAAVGTPGPRASVVPDPIDTTPIPLPPAPRARQPVSLGNGLGTRLAPQAEDAIPLVPNSRRWAPSPRPVERREARPPAQPPTAPQVAFTPQRPGASMVCVCSVCGTRLPHDGHLYCPGVRCPNCGHAMLPGVPIGGNSTPPAGTAAPAPTRSPIIAQTPTSPALAQQPVAPTPALQGQLVAAIGPTYDTTIAPIISRNCLRCHGGPVRNLGTYDNLKQYATNGLLSMMVQPGGPMSHFLTPSEGQTLLAWIQAGEPR